MWVKESNKFREFHWGKDRMAADSRVKVNAFTHLLRVFLAVSKLPIIVDRKGCATTVQFARSMGLASKVHMAPTAYFCPEYSRRHESVCTP